MRRAVALVLLAACPEPEPPTGVDTLCADVVVPVEATRTFGFQDDGTFIGPAGRLIVPAGPSTLLDGMPGDVVLHPNGAWAYVTATSNDDRGLEVVDIITGELVQSLDRAEAFHGMAMSPDGASLYASAGADGLVDVYDVDDGGLLTWSAAIDTGDWPSGIAVSPDGSTVWIGQLLDGRIDEVDTETMALTRSFAIGTDVWELIYVEPTNELYAGNLGDYVISVVDLTIGSEVAEVPASKGPAGFAVSADGTTVWAALSSSDRIIAIDTATHEVVNETRVALDMVGPTGDPLSLSNVNALWFDADTDRLYATRGADDMVGVYAASTLDNLGAIPTAFYPTAVELSSDGATLVVTEAKGGGVGPSDDGSGPKTTQRGSVTRIDMSTLDLAAATADAAAQFRSSLERFGYPCEDGDTFPVPEAYDGGSPIEHVILVVKENKTFDCLFGDMGEELDVDADPTELEWTEEIIPNQRALAREFNISDSFFGESKDSDSGHLFLTAAHWTEYTARLWWEFDENDGQLGYQLMDVVIPDVGNFFTHVLDHDRTLNTYGEVVGMFATTKDGELVVEHSDANFPGTGVINYTVHDEEKAQYVLDQIEDGDFAAFTYLSLPNDHTTGGTVGQPTPESMVADNDYAVGLLIEGLSRMDVWNKTIVFVLEDDPQGCDDHVDGTRSFLIVAGGYARRKYVSHATTSYLSVFATIERILGIPPMGRSTAAAAPVWDMFSSTPDTTPFEVRERIEEVINTPSAFGAAESAIMDFNGPDRDPRLYPLLHHYRQWQMGHITREEAERRLSLEHMGFEAEIWEELEEEAEEETFAFDRDFKRYQAWRLNRGFEPAKPGISSLE